MVQREQLCHDLAVMLVSKSQASTPEEAVKSYEKLLAEVESAYDKVQKSKGKTTNASVIPPLW